nr:hypothetical protein [Tanacetum cinerariifolium]
KEVDELKAERIAKTQDPLALMKNSNNPYVFPAPHQDQSSFNQNYLQQPIPNPEDITYPTTNSRVQNVRNQNGLIGVQGNGNQNQIGNGNLVAARAEGNEAVDTVIDCSEGRGRNLTPSRRQASTSGTQTDSAPVYDTDGSAKDTSVEQGGETVEQHPANFEETRALYESFYQNLARCFEISQEKYDKLERCYQQSVYQEQCLSKKINALHLSSGKRSVYQEQCLSKKINALHLSSGKRIMTLNEHIFELNKQLSKEKSTVSFLLEEKKKLKSDFKMCEDKFLDKQILLEKRIKELNNIVLKMGQSIQTIHMLLPKTNSFYHTEQKMASGYQNPFYLKQAQKKQQSLYDGKVLLEKHDPPVVHDSEETLQLA